MNKQSVLKLPRFFTHLLGYHGVPKGKKKMSWFGAYTIFGIQGGPERSRQSNLAVFTVGGGLDLELSYVK